ncbi:holo-ACP synthase [Mariprofundus ferrooxydans]|nr:holo-ACP synthase [Mariprofundus ferrooxydans]
MSIVGIGTDIVQINRIEQSFHRFEQRFINKVYTTAEYSLAQQRGTYRRLAMFFAAKEATAKALGTGFIGFGMKDIEVFYLDSGKPEIMLHGNAKQKAKQLGIAHIHVSLTDDAGAAMAFVIAETKP